MASLAIIAGFITATTIASAEEVRTAKNSIYAEGLGPGGPYSINYERLVIDDVAARVGFSYIAYSAAAGAAESSATMLFFPITASYIGLSSGSHALEIGAGTTLYYAGGSASSLGVSTSGSGMSAYGSGFVGYRIHPVNGGFQFRVGVATLFGPGLSLSTTDPGSFGAIPWAYLSLGGSF